MAKTVMGIQLNNRIEDATRFQDLLSKYGCSIQTRIGLHGAGADFCKSSGVIVLDFVEGADEDVKKFEDELKSFENILVQKMVF